MQHARHANLCTKMFWIGYFYAATWTHFTLRLTQGGKRGRISVLWGLCTMAAVIDVQNYRLRDDKQR